MSLTNCPTCGETWTTHGTACKQERLGSFAAPAGSARSTIMLAGTIGSILVRHGVIDRAAIEDPEGYDGGQTKQRVIDATIEIAKEAPNCD